MIELSPDVVLDITNPNGGELYMGGEEVEITWTCVPEGIGTVTLKVSFDGGTTYPDVIVAGTDRIAIDVVGLAVLREQGSPQITGKLFEQEQISRAVDLGLGIRFPRQIEFLTGDPESEAYAAELTEIIMQG